jgi:hypothetical protein
LVFVNLVSGAVYAWDLHTADPYGHHYAASTDPSGPAQSDSHACGHCCHMGAHLAGLCSTALSLEPPLDGIAHALEPFALIVTSPHPPLRPPIA